MHTHTSFHAGDPLTRIRHSLTRFAYTLQPPYRPDTCTCTKDWTGVTCTLPVCDKSCTEGGSGECIAPGQCKCQYGYSGPNCQDALPYWGTKDDGLTHVIVFAISAAFVLLLPTATVCWCRHRTGTGRACCNKNQQPQREGLLRPMLSIGSKTPTTDASATSESRRAWGVKWMTLAMLASVVELAGYSLAIMRIVCDNQDGVSGEAECFTWKSFLRQWKDVFTSGDGLNLKPQTLSDIGIILVTRLLVFRLLLPALSLCGRRPCRCNRRCMGHYTRLRVTEWLVVTFDVMATALAGAKLYLYKIELGDTLGNLKATVIVAFVTTCVMHVVVHSLALILESPQPQIVDALAVGATATTRKTADRGGPGPKTYTNDDGAPIRPNNDSGLFESDSSDSGNRVEAMFIDIMSSRHRYNPPKEPGQPAAKEGAGAEADEEETDVLPDIPASKNEDTAFRQESLEQKLERLSVSLGKGQMRKQEEDPAQRVESLYSTF